MKKEIKTEQDKFDYLLGRLQFTPSIRGDRDNILILGIYGEYVINYLFEKKFQKHHKKFKQNSKRIELLHDLGKFSEDQYNVLTALNTVRNVFAHELITSSSEKKVNEIMNRLKLISNDESQNKDLESLDRDYPYSKFQISCVTVIGNLMRDIAKEEKQEFPREVDFSLINKKTREEINDRLGDYFRGYYGQEKRKFGASNHGLNVVQAFLIGIMQDKIGDHIYLKQRPLARSPDVEL